MVVIAGYEGLTPLHTSSRSVVYRATRESDRVPVILKATQSEYPSLEELARFRLEHEILNRLAAVEGVSRAYGLEPHQSGVVLVLEDFGGESLQRLLLRRSLDVPEVLLVAIALTEILGQVHAANVIHKDVNPANVVYDADTGRIGLIDFGNATVLSRENPTLQTLNRLEGTLAYLSPEQTGRMNRSLDYRTDFYSLGATLYELLTGSPPFSTSDPMELIHSHLAKQPDPPHEVNPTVPSVFSQIVLKLLAKNAEDRYQSAYGLKTDLERCLVDLRATGAIAPFPLGQDDASGRFQIPQKLYGREREVQLLLDGFERVAAGQTAVAGSMAQGQDGEPITPSKLPVLRAAITAAGRSEVMLVAGYSGIGKSSLVQEIYKPITRHKGYFIAGKYDQFQRNLPYSALIQAFQELMRQLLTESQTQIDRWKTQLSKALGRNGQVVIEVIPEVELIIGPQPDVPLLAPDATQNRFNLVFQNFIQVFTQAEHPLVMFLDDLQWADVASLKLIERLLTAPDSRYLFLVGAYRSNEVSPAHPLMLTLDQIRQAGVRVNQIDLAPLDADTVQQIVADTCCAEPQAIAPLANYVMQITEGNPFFLTEFLKSLYTEGLLNYDASSGNWQWDLSQIRDTGLPEDVVELMADKIQKLEPDTQRVLRLAACLGNQFDVPTLAIVSELPQNAVAADLWQSVEEGLVMPLGEGYQFATLEQTDLEQKAQAIATTGDSQNDLSRTRDLGFRFLHDRVQQAAYSLIPEAERETIHYRIGRSLLTHSSADQQEDRLFDIVNHLNTGMGLITHPVERHELARLNLQAGTKAKESNAYDTALRYLRAGADLLDQHSWLNQYELTLALHEEATEAAYLKGDFDLVNQLADTILHHARADLDTVKAYQTQISAYSAQNNMDAALDVFVTAANRLGLNIPRHPSRLQVGLELMRTRFLVIGNRSSRDLEALPPMTDPVKEGIMRLVGSPIIAAANAAPYLIAITALRVINLVVKYGSSPQTAAQGVAYGVMLRAGLGDIDRAYDFGQLSLRVVERLNARQFKTIVIVGFESCLRHWKEPLRRSLPELLNAYAEGLELGNQEAASLAASVYCFHQLLLGEPLYEVAEAFQQYETQLLSFGQEQVVYSMLPWHQLVLHLRGQGIEGDRLVGSIYNEDELIPQFIDRQLGVPLFYGSIAKVMWAYHIGDYATAIKTGKQAVAYQESSPVTSLYALLYFYWPLSYLAHYNSVSPKVQRQYLRQIDKFLRMAKRWATYCPANYLHRHLLLEAERLRVLGRKAEAIDAYDQAIQAAKDNNFINDLALAQELAGKFYLASGKERLAQSYLIDARYTYLRWGATYKVDALNTLYPQLLDRRMEASSRANLLNQIVSLGSSNSTGGSQGLNLDLDTVIKAAQAISGEIVLANLLEKLLKLAIENAGAQKGCLLLLQGDELRIEAEGQLEEEELVRVQSRSPDEQTLPLSLIYYVQRTREDVVLRDAVEEGLFTTDPYIVQHQLRSALCSPILNQGNLIGLLYLENNLATDTFTPERVTVLNILSAQAAIALENAQFYRTLEQKVEERTAQLARANDEITLLNQQLQSENLRMGAELAITRQIQQMVLPKDHELDQIEGLEIAGFMEPADEVGGDYYDVLHDNGAVKIGIGDITGHGLESGMLMLMVQTAVRTLLSTQETDSVRFLSTLNRVIYDNVQRMNCDRSLTLALLDYEAGQLRLSGQHEEVLVVRANGEIESINTMTLGFPVGLVEDISDFITHTHIHLQPGDGVVLYTDGITEAANEIHELYGIERLCAVISQNWQRPVIEIRQAVIDDVRRHIGQQKVFDDITLLIVKQR
ncbi:MAG: AAA family ATPase [Cyanobacteriota bacterium]